jgi:hypothetical protein
MLLNVSPFNIPNELIDYVAQHTSPALREFKVGKNQIVFTKDMVTKVFGIVLGCKPVVPLKRSEQSNLRDVYRGSNPRPDIPTTIKILRECDITDEEIIVRSWDILCMANVVDPRSSNHVNMDYLGSMSDPSKTHEYAWDEYILDLAMKEVNKMHKKRVKPLVFKGQGSKFEYWNFWTVCYSWGMVPFLQYWVLCTFLFSYLYLVSNFYFFFGLLFCRILCTWIMSSSLQIIM